MLQKGWHLSYILKDKQGFFFLMGREGGRAISKVYSVWAKTKRCESRVNSEDVRSFIKTQAWDRCKGIAGDEAVRKGKYL